ncbi:MAG TPA: ArsC/Spx/MgsR family protein [Nocardioides sp.]|nr:ArsC/Spx/MgsR family protein [Nocardioides sp.]
MEIWLNPACSKCRTAVAELDAAGIDLPREQDQHEAWLAALADHPRAIQRPIITAADGTTVVGRDPESLDRVLDAER